MAKFKPARKKPKAGAPQSGIPCLILLISGMLLLMLFLYLVMKSAS